MANTMLSEVILRSQRDWDAWIKARENETPKAIWTIVNPDLEDDMADKPLPKSVCPTPASLKANATNVSELSDQQISSLDKLDNHYQRANRQWGKQQEEFAKLRATINRTVAASFLNGLNSTMAEREWFKDLAKQCKPTAYEREQYVQNDLDDLMAKHPAMKTGEEWLQKWRNLMAKAIYYQTAESRSNTWAPRLLKAWKTLCPILVENLQSAVSKGTELTVIDADAEF
jgi:hypothetical protein